MTHQSDFVEIPGSKEINFELPPLLLSNRKPFGQKTFEVAKVIAENDCLDSSIIFDERKSEIIKYDLACNLAEKYSDLCTKWSMGDSIMRWIGECESQFAMTPPLANILRPQVWPRVGQYSFVMLLQDKHIADQADLRTAIGLRLSFRQLHLKTLTGDFLMYLSPVVTEKVYNQWVDLTPQPIKKLPPERFHFQVIKM